MKHLFCSIMGLGVAMSCYAQTVSGDYRGYDYVDLGLPSGTKWATYNVGAEKTTEYGDYYAWGEVSVKGEYNWTTLQYYEDGSYTKYCSQSDLGTVDNKEELDAFDDVACVRWGGGWRMPTDAELHELVLGCEWVWTDNYGNLGVSGQIGTSKKNGNTIFFPAAGCFFGTEASLEGTACYYWSSSLSQASPSYACNLFANTNVDIYWNQHMRCRGHSVRAVFVR